MKKSPPSSIALVPATTLSHDRLTLLINHAYMDYYLPVSIDATQFARMCAVEDIDLRQSVVALGDDTPVGIALLARRGDAGWVSGVGVLSPWRRRGIARQLVEHLQAIAHMEGLRTLRLEVLAQNEGGHALYQQLNFRWERDLVVLTLEPGTFDPRPLPSGVTPASPGVVLASYAAFHDVHMPWQRQRPSLVHRHDELRGLAMWESARIIGYVLYQLQQGSHVVADLAVAPDHPQRLHVARTLLTGMHSARPDMGGSTINLPTDDPLLPAFTGLRYRIWQRQHALVWEVGE
jgi:GNAT superfamily N-acetyltransferase